MKSLWTSMVILAVAVLVFLVCSPALAQKPEKTEKPWVGTLADGRSLTRAELDEILREHALWLESEGKKGKRADLSGAILESANLTRAYLSKANLSKAKLLFADLRGADLQNADLSNANFHEADMANANLIGANLSKAGLGMADLKGADLSWADLSGANLYETDLTDADLKQANLSCYQMIRANLTRANFEPEAGSLPDASKLIGIEGLQYLTYLESSHGLLELREIFKKAGMRDDERQVTYAINHTRREILMEGGFWGKLEGAFQYVFFELTCQYGMSPGRPLEILGAGLLVFTLPYLLALWSRDRKTGIWVVLPPDRILGKGDKYPSYKLTHRTPFRPLPIGLWARLWARFKRVVRVLRLAFYFSLLSAFRLGWRELNVGNWISRLQKHEYILGATGWPRFVAGFQSLLSVYLVALWALTYFGRPFD